MRILPSILFLFILETVHATDLYPRNDAIDIRHYRFKLELYDSTDRVSGETIVEIRFRKPVTEFELDLAGVDGQGKGMQVREVLTEDLTLRFVHQNDRLKIFTNAQAGEERKFVIRYAGIPRDGLIISRNKFGDRTFFGDNWPNRAHQWLPTIDHPYDKATCEFIVLAPEKYSVIGTGTKIEESAIGKNRKLTHWRTSIILPTKVMVIGAASFAIQYVGEINKVPLESWVYPQNREAGFSDYSIAAKPLDFLSKSIAPFPYEKLANVQSTTLYGGMENASNIFYSESSVTGKGNIEKLVAHEVAHQWFGDSASEADWYHVWLSEGFATYFANLYFENTYGTRRLMQEMETDRKEVTDFYRKKPSAIVNTNVTDLLQILNANSYQKGSWVLHMLRHEVGDQKFWEGIREYYRQFQLGNAMTDDFRKVMENVSGMDLKPFFDQWIFRSGHPRLDVHWTFNSQKKALHVIVEQKQEQLFNFPLEMGITGSQGQRIEKVFISARKQEFSLPSGEKPVGIMMDPNVWLLFEGIVEEVRK